MGKKPVIKLRTYRGSDINYDEDRNIKNENNLVSLIHGTRGWTLFMKNLPLNGLCKVSVEKGFNENEDGGYDEIKDLSEFQKEVDEAFNPKKQVILTEADKKIAELQAQLDAFMNKGSDVKKKDEKDEEKNNSEDSLSEKQKLQGEYQEFSGKRAFHGWDEETLKNKIKGLK